MKILVTGGAGLIGSHAAEYYANKGDEVIVLDNLMRSKLFNSSLESVEYNWNYLSNFDNITKIKGDVRNEENVMKAIGDGVDAVIHTAGQPGVPLSVRIPKEDFSINGFGTLNVLDCLRVRSPKAAFAYCSTNKIYGENVDLIPLEEKETRYIYKDGGGVKESLTMDLTGHTPYGASKYVGDIYAQEYYHSYGMRTAAFRMSCIYGTRQFGFEDQGWVAWFIIAALLGKLITIYGDGKQVRDVLYVDDVVKAYDSFIQSDNKGGVWNVGGGINNTSSLLEFLTLIENKLNTKINYTFSDWRPSDQKVYISDTTKLESELGWKAETTFEEGVEKLINWAKENIKYFEE